MGTACVDYVLHTINAVIKLKISEITLTIRLCQLH